MPLLSLLRGLLAASGITASVAAAAAAVIVSFPDVAHYTDAGDGPEAKRIAVEVGYHLERLGERYLAPSQTLRVEVLDIDLAGRTRFPSRGPSEVRVLNGRADWPSMKLRYTLESGGKISAIREETIADPGYLLRGARSVSGELLYYEKRMLDTWFRQRFAERNPIL